jgi:hypothetical protein
MGGNCRPFELSKRCIAAGIVRAGAQRALCVLRSRCRCRVREYCVLKERPNLLLPR